MEVRNSFRWIILSVTLKESRGSPNRRGTAITEVSFFAMGAFSPGKERFKLLNTITATIKMAIREKAIPQSLCVNIYVYMVPVLSSGFLAQKQCPAMF
jgi:hypothetical protein